MHGKWSHGWDHMHPHLPHAVTARCTYDPAEEAGSACGCRSSLGAASPWLADGEGGVAPRPSRRVGGGQIRLEEFVLGVAVVSRRRQGFIHRPIPNRSGRLWVGWISILASLAGAHGVEPKKAAPPRRRVRSDAA